MEQNTNVYQSSFRNSTDKPPNGNSTPSAGLRRRLDARHVSMIATGATLGTGIVIGTGFSLALAGPASLLIAYAVIGGIVYFVMADLCELASFAPVPDGLAGYVTRTSHPALGFAVGWTYFLKTAVVSSNQLLAASWLMEYWVPRSKVSTAVWVEVFWTLSFAANFLPVRWLGHAAYWISALKVITLTALCILMIVIATTGDPMGEAFGFRFWRDPGAFELYSTSQGGIGGSAGKFVAWAAILQQTIYSFLGVESVGIATGEARLPAKAVPRAFKITFFRILLLYLVLALLVGIPVSTMDPTLVRAASDQIVSSSVSPFIIAINNVETLYLAGVLNGAFVLFVAGAAISELYASARTLHGLANLKMAPNMFLKTNKYGTPCIAVSIASLPGLVAYVCVSDKAKDVFRYFVNMSTTFGILTWIGILVSYLGFRKSIRHRDVYGIDSMYSSVCQPFGSYLALLLLIILLLFKNFTVFVFKFDAPDFVTGYIGIPVFAILLLGYKFYMIRSRPDRALDIFEIKELLYEDERALLENENREVHKMKWYHKAYENFFRFWL